MPSASSASGDGRGLKVPQKQPKRGRLWLNDGSCIRLRPEHPNHVWSYDFVEGRTHNGRKFRMLNIIDEFTRECLAIRIDRKLNSTDVIDALSDLFILRGVPGHVRSDNGPEFIAKAVREWIAAVGAKTAFIEPGSPWENGYCESFNSEASRRTPQQRDLLQPRRGKGHHRSMAALLQHQATTLIARIQTAGSGGHCLAFKASRIASASNASNGRKAHHALRLKADHLIGAGQYR